MKTLNDLRNTIDNSCNSQHHHFHSSTINFTAFDFVVAAYWHRSHPGEQLPMEYKHEKIIDAYDTIKSLTAEIAAAAVQAIPVVGTSVSTGIDLASRITELIRQKYTEHNDSIIQHIKKLFQQDNTLLAPTQIAQLAAPALAHDVSLYTANGQRKVVLVLDEFENLLNDASVGQNYRVLTEFIRLSEGLLVAIGSREQLPEVSSSFDSLLDKNQHHLKGLDKQFAEEYLIKQGTPKKFHEAMIDCATVNDPDTGKKTVFPLFLNLQTQSFHNVQRIKQQAAQPSEVEASDIIVHSTSFEERLNELTGRLFRGYDLQTRASIQQLICARSVTDDLKNELIQKRNVNAQAADLMISQHYAHIDDHGTLSFHEPFGNVVRKQLQNDKKLTVFFRDTHTFLRNYHQQRIKPIDHKTSPLDKQKNLEAFHAALYHVFQLGMHTGGPKEAINMTGNWALQQTDKIYHQMRDSHLPLIRPVYQYVAQHVLANPKHQDEYFTKIQPSSLFITGIACQQLYDKADEALQELGLRGKKANMYTTSILIKYLDVAQIAEQLGDIHIAKGFYQKALQLQQKANGEKEDHGTAIIYRDLAAIADKLGDKNEALNYLTQSLTLKKTLPDISQDELIDTQIHLASLHLKYSSTIEDYKAEQGTIVKLINDSLQDLENLQSASIPQEVSREILDKKQSLFKLKQQANKIRNQGNTQEQMLSLLTNISAMHHGAEHPDTLAIEDIMLNHQQNHTKQESKQHDTGQQESKQHDTEQQNTLTKFYATDETE